MLAPLGKLRASLREQPAGPSLRGCAVLRGQFLKIGGRFELLKSPQAQPVRGQAGSRHMLNGIARCPLSSGSCLSWCLRAPPSSPAAPQAVHEWRVWEC